MKTRLAITKATLLLLLITSCEKDPTSTKNNTTPEPALKGVFIANEVVFQLQMQVYHIWILIQVVLLEVH